MAHTHRVLAGIPTVTPIDGTTMTVPDTPAVRTRLTKQAGNHGGTGYPQVRLVALLACGTRTLVDAVFGLTTGETTYTPRLLASLRAGMTRWPAATSARKT